VRVQENNKGQVNLTKNNFVACGGEGSVYVHGEKAYKIYADPKKMIPQAKISELSAITFPNIIKPEGTLTISGRKDPVGYTMRYVKDTIAMCPLFTKGFKKRNNITTDNILKIVRQLREGVEHIHSKNILVVDLNETNFLVDQQFKNVYFIDVDSYQTKNYPATALMDSVKDWHANGKWTQGSDWFSWGIISFQLFIGLHPYKGKHSSLNMEERMKKNISVFNKDVSVPRVAENFDTIPQAYKEWYKAVFEDGVRAAPPINFMNIIPVATVSRPIVSSAQLNITDIWTADTPIKSYHHIEPWEAVITTDETVHYGQNKKFGRINRKKTDFLFSTIDGKLIGASFLNKEIELYNLENGDIANIKLQCKEAMVYDNRFYIQKEEQVLEVEAKYLAGKLTAITKPVANVTRNSTSMFDGIVVQNMLGTWWTTSFPKAGQSFQNRIQELDGQRIIDAKHRRGILMVIGQKDGKYNRFIYIAHPITNKFSLINQESNISYHGINFTVLDNGVCVLIDENEDILLFPSNLPLNIITKKIQDPIISSNMLLCNRGLEAFFLHDETLKKISMK
jgi:serine/threonine protein kinase